MTAPAAGGLDDDLLMMDAACSRCGAFHRSRGRCGLSEDDLTVFGRAIEEFLEVDPHFIPWSGGIATRVRNNLARSNPTTRREATACRSAPRGRPCWTATPCHLERGSGARCGRVADLDGAQAGQARQTTYRRCLVVAATC